VLDRPEFVRNRRVMDFAAGSGVAAIAAACAGANAVANDIDPLALAAVGLNAQLNDVEVENDRSNLLIDAAAGEWDVILAGDVCYEREPARQIWQWLQQQAAAGTLVLLGDPGRAYLPVCGLRPLASYAVPTSLELEDSDMRTTTVWQVTVAKGG
jgi:predicted nicotinamide N-methyase